MNPSLLIRQLLGRMLRRGPTRILPFIQFADHDRLCAKYGIHSPEPASGVLRVEADAPFCYRASVALLGQNPKFGVTPKGNQHRSSLLGPGREKVLYLLADAAVMGSEGLIYEVKQMAAVAETALMWDSGVKDNSLLNTVRFPPPSHLPGLSLSLVVRSGSSYYHFLQDGLARLALARDFLPMVRHVIVNGSPKSFHTRWLLQAGVPIEKIVWAGPHAHFTCDQILFTGSLLHDQQPTAWNLAAVRAATRFQSGSQAPSRQIWISRKNALTRQIAWEAQALRDLPDFERVVLDEMDAAEQMHLFNEARILIGPHGAGLTNLAFCQPGTRVVEIFPPDFKFQPLFTRWAQVADLQPTWVEADFHRQDAWPPLRTALVKLISQEAAPSKSDTRD